MPNTRPADVRLHEHQSKILGWQIVDVAVVDVSESFDDDAEV